MTAITHAERSLALINKAYGLTTRLGFAAEAGIAESTIRKIGTPGWNPKFQVLLTCERAAQRIIAEWRARHGGRA